MVAERRLAWFDTIEDGEALIARLHGEMDIAAVPVIQPLLMGTIALSSAVTVDLADVTFLDASGVAMFFAIAQKAEAEGTVLSVRNAPSNVRRVFEIAGLDREIDVRE